MTDKTPEVVVISRQALGLGVEAAVAALSPAAIESIMITLGEEDTYRQALAFAVKRTGKVDGDALSEAINRTIVRERIHESYFTHFVSEALKAVVRSRAQSSGQYGASDLKRDFGPLLAALEKEGVGPSAEGSLGRLGLESSIVASPDLGWIDSCDRDVLKRAREALVEVKRALDTFSEKIVIDEYGPTPGGFVPRPDDAERLVEDRRAILRMLKVHRVIEDWAPQRDQFGSTRGFVIKAEPTSVGPALEAMSVRRNNRSPSVVRTGPTESPPPTAEEPSRATGGVQAEAGRPESSQQEDSRPQMNFIAKAQAHPVWTLLSVCVLVAGVTWTVEYRVMVQPRDFAIERLEQELEKAGGSPDVRGGMKTARGVSVLAASILEEEAATTEDGLCTFAVRGVRGKQAAIGYRVAPDTTLRVKWIEPGEQLVVVLGNSRYVLVVDRVRGNIVDMKVYRQEL